MTRITKAQKAIADAHINAKMNGMNFTGGLVKSKEELAAGLRAGVTYKRLLDEIELRYVNMTSLMVLSVLNHKTNSYKSNVYKGFRIALTSLGIR